MISVVISSVDEVLLKRVKINIEQTISIDFEVISFNNSSGRQGLCELYNLGAKKAKYNILCFMHEDVDIETMDWGKKVLSIFKEHSPGVLGVGGSTYKSYAPSGWCPPGEFGIGSWRLNVKQGSKYSGKNEAHDYYNPHNETLSDVVCLDGVWLCTTKEIAIKYRFDEDLLKGFHGYDIDFSLNVSRNYKLMVTYDILLYHASEGNFNTHWLKELIKVNQKWERLLPLGKNEFSEVENKDKEKKALSRLLKEICRNKGFSLTEVNAILSHYHKDLSSFFFIKWHAKAFLKRFKANLFS